MPTIRPTQSQLSRPMPSRHYILEYGRPGKQTVRRYGKEGQHSATRHGTLTLPTCHEHQQCTHRERVERVVVDDNDNGINNDDNNSGDDDNSININNANN